MSQTSRQSPRVKTIHPRYWTAEAIAYLREHYAETPNKRLAEKLGRSVWSIYLKAEGLGLRKTQLSRRYVHNANAFDELAPQTAWLVGFLLADGNVSGNRFRISNTYLPILKKARAILGSDHPFCKRANRRGNVWYDFGFSDERITRRLHAIGIVPRKSYIGSWPKIPDQLFWHTLRGYFDGDGSAVFKGSHHGGLVLSWPSGSRKLLDGLASEITRIAGIQQRHSRLTKGRNTWVLTYLGHDALSIGDRMYVDALTLYIPRKRESFERYRQHLFAGE